MNLGKVYKCVCVYVCIIFPMHACVYMHVCVWRRERERNETDN